MDENFERISSYDILSIIQNKNKNIDNNVTNLEVPFTDYLYTY